MWVCVRIAAFNSVTIVRRSLWVKKKNKQNKSKPILWYSFLSDCNTLSLYDSVCALRGKALPLSGTFEVYKRRSEESGGPRRAKRSRYRISHAWHICFISSQDMTLGHDAEMTRHFTATTLSKLKEQTSSPSGNPTADWTVSAHWFDSDGATTLYTSAERKTNGISAYYQRRHTFGIRQWGEVSEPLYYKTSGMALKQIHSRKNIS